MKVKLPLCLCITLYSRVRGYRHADIKLHIFSALAVDTCEWSASCSGRFIPGIMAVPGADWMVGWMSIAVGLDMVAREKSQSPAGGRTPVGRDNT
jgi:hypothetical protein